MRLRIYNKENLIDNTKTLANGRYALSNLKGYTIDENSLLTENYNEQLDSMMIRLSHLEDRLDIEPYDLVIVDDDPRFQTKYFCVDTYTMKEETLNQNNYVQKYYTYEISLMSQTKLLEGAVLPNLSITQRKGEGLTPIYSSVEGDDSEGLIDVGVIRTVNTITFQFDELIGQNPEWSFNVYIGQTQVTYTNFTRHFNSATGEVSFTFTVENYTETADYLQYFWSAKFITGYRETNKRTILDYITEYMDLYCPKNRLPAGSGNTYTNDYTGICLAINGQLGIGFEMTDLIGKNITTSFLRVEIPQRITVSPYTQTWNSTTGILEVSATSQAIPNGTHGAIIRVSYFDPTPEKNIISISQNVINKFQDVECPEFQWNAPTLREVLTDLFMVKDCIPIVRDRVLDFIDLTQVGNEIPNYNYIQWSQSSEDYISEVKMNLQNVTQTSVKGIGTTVTTTEYIPFVTDDYVSTSENLELKTQFPILNIKHLWLIQTPYRYQSGRTLAQFVKVDLCNIENMLNTTKNNLVVEQKEWATKEVKYLMGYGPETVYNNATASNDIDTFYSKYKNFYLYFNRGSNVITGFNQMQNVVLAADQPTWKWIRALALASQVKNGVDEYALLQYFLSTTHDKQYYSCFFQIEYETMADAVFQAGKNDFGANQKVIVDNQTNSWVDAYNQGNLEYQKANRLGNKAILINQRVSGNGNLIQIGQKHYDQQNDETYIIYQTQYQIHKDHIEVNALACENYVLKDYFTGVNSKIRTWVNAQDEALIRHDLNKYYCEFSFLPSTETIETDTNNKIAKAYLSPLEATQRTDKIKQVLVNTYSKNTVMPDSSQSFALNQITRLCGNSIVHSFGFNDNASVGKTVDTTVITSSDIQTAHRTGTDYYYPTLIHKNLTNYGGIPLQDLFFADGTNNYEYDRIKFTFTNNVRITEGQFTMPENCRNFIYTGDDVKFYMNCLKKPLARENAYEIVRYGKTLEYIKDNREMPKISTQFELCSESKDIYFTKNYLANHVDLLEGTKPTLHVYMTTQDKYKRGATSESTLQLDTHTSIEVDGKILWITYNSAIPETDHFKNKFLAIGTSPNDIWLGIRFDETFTDENYPTRQIPIYMNVLKQRSKKVYNSNGIIIGEI